MIKLTQKKLIELIKEKSGIDVIYLGRFVDNTGLKEEPRRMAFWDIKNNKLIGLLEDKLYDILSK